MNEILVNIDVPNLEDGVAFYSNGLSFEKLRVFGGRVAEMSAGNCRVYLLAKSEGTPSTTFNEQHRPYMRHWTTVHLDVSVPRIESALEKAQAAGGTLESGPETHEWGTIAELSDPFGNGFCIIQFTEAGYDAIDT